MVTTDAPVEAGDTDRARDTPDPARPVLFWVQVVLSPVVAASVVVWLLVQPGALPSVTGLSNGALLSLGVAVVLVVLGELSPIIGARSKDPLGVAWSTTFAFAVLVFAGVLPAIVLYAGAAVVSGLVARKRAFRWMFNAGQYTLSLLAAHTVLVNLGVEPRLDALWAPTSFSDLGIVLLAAGAFFLTNEMLVTGVVCALNGAGVRKELNDTMSFELAVNGSQLLLAPLVAVIMLNTPPLTILAVLPVAAIHLTIATSRESERAATHDDLTGLANRKRFIELTEQAITEARPGSTTGLFLLDLDRFKEVNDVLGHPAGDRALVEVGARLQRTLRGADVVSRLGGDEFAFVVRDLAGPGAAVMIAERVASALGEPFDLDGQPVDLDGSIGIALVPQHGRDFETLFSRADVAMYSAKRESSGVTVYDPEADASSLTRVGMLGALRRALDNGELVLQFQPKVALSGGRTPGVEALVRWHHPDGVTVLPDDFIPIAEQSGLMPRLTGEVLEMALSQCADWLGRGLRVPVAVNVSLRDLLDVEFADTLAARLVRFGIPASLLTLEVTERLLAGDLDRVATTMAAVDALGVQLSLDDFGTGYSSLMLLRALPVTEIKLDRSFISRVADSDADATIVRAIAGLAHSLGLGVVAEGVESGEVARALAALGCDTAQGWYFARPMSAATTTTWLETHATSAHRERAEAAVPAQPRSG